MSTDRRVVITLGVEVRAQLEAAARVSGVSMSALAKRFIQAGLSGENGKAMAVAATDRRTEIDLALKEESLKQAMAKTQALTGQQWGRGEVVERLGRHAEMFRGSLGAIRGEWTALAALGVSRDDAEGFLTELEARLVADVRRGCDVATASVEAAK